MEFLLFFGIAAHRSNVQSGMKHILGEEAFPCRGGGNDNSALLDHVSDIGTFDDINTQFALHLCDIGIFDLVAVEGNMRMVLMGRTRARASI